MRRPCHKVPIPTGSLPLPLPSLPLPPPSPRCPRPRSPAALGDRAAHPPAPRRYMRLIGTATATATGAIITALRNAAGAIHRDRRTHVFNATTATIAADTAVATITGARDLRGSQNDTNAGNINIYTSALPGHISPAPARLPAVRGAPSSSIRDRDLIGRECGALHPPVAARAVPVLRRYVPATVAAVEDVVVGIACAATDADVAATSAAGAGTASGADSRRRAAMPLAIA